MYARRGLAVLVVITLLALPSVALAGQLILHPSGFGEKSYAAWKAKEGEPDSKGNDFQALYFQKMTTTATNAAGVAVIKGLEGLPSSALTGLAWDHRVDGHCGAGAPRWNVTIDTGSSTPTTVFLGCNAAEHQQLPISGPSGQAWCRDTQPSAALGNNLPAGTIRGLAIVFDEGNDIPNPPPPPCGQTSLAGGFVYLDNITVVINGQAHVWTGASDNGNGQTIMQAQTGTAFLESLLGFPVSLLFK